MSNLFTLARPKCQCHPARLVFRCFCFNLSSWWTQSEESSKESCPGITFQHMTKAMHGHALDWSAVFKTWSLQTRAGGSPPGLVEVSLCVRNRGLPLKAERGSCYPPLRKQEPQYYSPRQFCQPPRDLQIHPPKPLKDTQAP